MGLRQFYYRLKHSGYPLWYNLTVGIIVDSRLYWHLYYKHSKKHKSEMNAVRERVLKHRMKILGK
jgi:hypothetical protein